MPSGSKHVTSSEAFPYVSVVEFVVVVTVTGAFLPLTRSAAPLLVLASLMSVVMSLVEVLMKSSISTGATSGIVVVVVVVVGEVVATAVVGVDGVEV